MGTVETPFSLLCTVYSNSPIIENKMHTEAVCLCTAITYIMETKCPHKYSDTSKVWPYWNMFVGPHDEASL